MAQVLPIGPLGPPAGAPAPADVPAAAPERARRMLGETLVRAGTLAQDALDRALSQQRAFDAPLGRILLAEDMVTGDGLLRGLAAQAELPVADLKASPPDPRLLAGLDPFRCLELEAVPWRQVGETRIIAVSRPASAAAAAGLAGSATRVEVVLACPADIRRAITTRFSARLSSGASTRCPARYSCRDIGTRRRRWRGVGLAGLLAALAWVAPLVLLGAVLAWVLAMNAATTGLRLFALFARFRSDPPPLSPDVPRLADFKRLPTVSLLVPLKGEASVAGELIGALRNIDYPPALLDIKLVLEEDDLPTRAALERAGLPPWFEILTVPKDERLQTKPRAMNYALPFCRGSVVGVYDAEDRPDPAQIRAVVQALGEAPPEVACVQGVLDFYNPTDNWLARCFTVEYAIWFRVLLRGVQRLGIPIPLGGTTVFFRRRALEAVGGWDAHNVTEDADLGMRLARFGYRCEMIPSVTLEEANCRARRWIGQRSRWLKGYAITWATHMRRPRALLDDLGWRGFLGFQVLFLGGMTSYLSLPLFWGLWLAQSGLGIPLLRDVPVPLVWAFAASMIAGQGVMLAVAAVALRDAGRRGMLLWVPTLPVYWSLGALAAYRAVTEVFTRPFHWTKTEHGLAREGRVERPWSPRGKAARRGPGRRA